MFFEFITKALLLILASFIFFTIWCLPFGITSLIYASKVDSLWAKGDFDGAIDAANKAYKSFRWGIWVGIGTILLYAIIIFLIVIGVVVFNSN